MPARHPRPWHDRTGATMVEYALMLAFVAIVCVAAVALFGGKVVQTARTNSQVIGAATEKACTDGGGSWDPATDVCTL